MYEKELQALKKAGRFRERTLYPDALIDLASNDYLGLARRKKSFKKAVKLVEEYDTFAPRASQLVNGYHPIHRMFERQLCKLNRFEEAMIVGSGFLANLSLIEALLRKGDMLFMDEEYHASGQLAAKLHPGRVVTFRHNDAQDLRKKISQTPAKRRIIAVEGVYSMSGALCAKEIFDVADEAEALLIVDEAHSSGVLGENLLGIFEHYGIAPHERHIKMGTLGKAYGSYGAYILAGKHIISFLENRAKAVIYTTAPSVFDTALAHINTKYIAKHAKILRKKIMKHQKLTSKVLAKRVESLIVTVKVNHNTSVTHIQQKLVAKGFLVGAIRPPTVTWPILRIIPRIDIEPKDLKRALKSIDTYQLQFTRGD